MDGQNFKNFVITILQVNKIDSDSWSVIQSYRQIVRPTIQTTLLKLQEVPSSLTVMMFKMISAEQLSNKGKNKVAKKKLVAW